jgi:hypothetical protein
MRDLRRVFSGLLFGVLIAVRELPRQRKCRLVAGVSCELCSEINKRDGILSCCMDCFPRRRHTAGLRIGEMRMFNKNSSSAYGLLLGEESLVKGLGILERCSGFEGVRVLGFASAKFFILFTLQFRRT